MRIREIIFTVALLNEVELDIAQSSPGYRDVQLGPNVFHVPYQQYHVGVPTGQPQYPALAFSLILPELAPITSDPAEVATWGKGTGWHRELHILVQYYVNYISQQQQFDNAFQRSAEMEVLVELDPLHPHVIPILSRDNFSIEQNGCKRYYGYAGIGNIMDVCGSGDLLLVAICNTDPGPASWHFNPYCQVMVNYADKTQLTYAFGYDYLPFLPEIQNKLTALLDSWKQPTSN